MGDRRLLPWQLGIIGLISFHLASACTNGGNDARKSLTENVVKKNDGSGIVYYRCWDSGIDKFIPRCVASNTFPDSSNGCPGNITRLPAASFATYKECTDYMGYWLCYVPTKDTNECVMDYMTCKVPYYSIAAVPPGTVQPFSSQADCQAFLPNWVRCAGSNGPVCRKEKCAIGEIWLNRSGREKFDNETHCVNNLYAGRPCYFAVNYEVLPNNNYYVVEPQFDHLGSSCPEGAIMLSGTWTWGHNPTLILQSLLSLYPTLWLNHYRCTHLNNNTVCRPDMGTPDKCGRGEKRLTASFPNVFSSLGSCNQARYGALLCHSMAMSQTVGQEYMCVNEATYAVYNGCPPPYEVVLSYGSSVSPDDALATCAKAANDSNVLWVRCQKADNSRVCRPKATGCSGAETQLQPAAGLTLTNCTAANYLSYRACYNMASPAEPQTSQPYFSCVNTNTTCAAALGVANMSFTGPLFYDWDSCVAFNPNQWVRCTVNATDVGSIVLTPGQGVCRPYGNCNGYEYAASPIGFYYYANSAPCIADLQYACYNKSASIRNLFFPSSTPANTGFYLSTNVNCPGGLALAPYKMGDVTPAIIQSVVTQVTPTGRTGPLLWTRCVQQNATSSTTTSGYVVCRLGPSAVTPCTALETQQPNTATQYQSVYDCLDPAPPAPSSFCDCYGDGGVRTCRPYSKNKLLEGLYRTCCNFGETQLPNDGTFYKNTCPP